MIKACITRHFNKVSNTELLNKVDKQVKYKHTEMHTYFKDEVFSYLLHIHWGVIKYVQQQMFSRSLNVVQ
jgi:hypothetical protein